MTRCTCITDTRYRQILKGQQLPAKTEQYDETSFLYFLSGIFRESHREYFLLTATFVCDDKASFLA